MSKKILATNYTIDADSDRITVKGFYRAEQFQLITDVNPETGGTILYNFADGTKGYKSVTFDDVSETTTIQLETDLSAYGINDSSYIQIIVDHPEVEMEVSDALLDPVHKIRVSTPENLIDTDFEYGLQPTKWETLELSNNVPSFYVADGDTALSIVNSVAAVEGSNTIKVECTDAHNLVVGTPIDVSGLDFRTAEGKFLITQADSNNFYYRANAPMTVTGAIGSLYTAITPGSFYAGSQIPYELDSGLTTDNQDSSKVTISTGGYHGFVENNQFYLVNTVASKGLKFSKTGLAPDNRGYIDPAENIQTTLNNIDLSLTNTTQIRGHYSHYFSAADIDVGSNTINWPGHNLYTNYCLLYNPPAGGAQIGGLNRFDIYYVIRVDQDTIRLSTSRSGSAITFTSAGDDSYARHSLHLVYEVYRSYKAYQNSYTYHYFNNFYLGGNESGYDRRQVYDGTYGLGSGNPYGVMMLVRGYNYPGDGARWLDYYRPEYHQYNTAYGANQTYWRIPEYDPSAATNEPSRWNPLEDFTRFQNYNWQSYWYLYNGSAYLRMQTYYYSGTYNYTWGSNRRIFAFPFNLDQEADTFYAPDHGLVSGQTIDFRTLSGDAPRISNATTTINAANANTDLADGTYSIDAPSTDRFRISGNRIVQSKGDSDNAYEIIANVKNETANSFYIEDHGLIDDQEVKFTTVGSPTVPSQNSGNLSPNWQPNTTGNNVIAFKSMDDYLSTAVPAIPNQLDFLTYNHNGSSNLLMQYGQNTSVTPVDYVNTWYTTSYFEVRKDGTRVTYGYPSSTDLQLKNFNRDTPFNLFTSQSADLKSYGLSRLATPWQQNTFIPYYVDMTFGNRNMHNNATNTTDYWRFYNYSYIDWRYSPSISSSIYQRRSMVATSSGDTYGYGYSITYGEYSAYSLCQINISITNLTNWPYYNSTYHYNYSYGNNRYRVHYDFGYYKDDINVRLWFMGNQNMNYTNPISLIEGMINAFDAGFIYATIADGETVNAKVINNNRFSLSKNSANIDFTDSGSSIDINNYLKFTVEEVAGAVDGSYSAVDVTDDTIVLQTPFEIGGNTESLKADSVDGDYIIPITGGHPFLSGTKVNYSADSALPGLTNNTDYYVFAVDDNHVQLMSDLQDAIAGSNPLTVGTDSANSVHTITTNSVAGRTLASGTVSATAGSKNIIGSQTLFKRYFKSGDKIFIKDDSTDPGRLYEYTVATVSDDENMQLSSEAITTGEELKHFVVTNVYVKPDGYSVHRPFDGGVEIGAGTAPFSQITRQTRKYFRYQSGKGIQTSLAINFNPPVILESITSSGTTIRCRTKYPHRLSASSEIVVSNSSDEAYNGSFTVASIVDDYNFTYTATSTPSTSIPNGIIQYNVVNYSGSYLRAGMFDNQNGFFFEWDGTVLHCVRRSSTTQLSGTVRAEKNNNLIVGTGTNFSGQLTAGDKVVIRGQTYKIVKITSRSEMYIQPQYRGVTADGIILTKTIDLRIPQDDWNLDRCDGTGKEGFVINTKKIQMAYMDYSWYGAGKIRFGFKDRKGHVRYAHEFIHNNRLDEAYMRSGNLPAKYEIENDQNPTYAPTLFHWGTSVIMDGTFDDDKAYLFTAPSKTLTFSNGQAVTATSAGSSSLIARYNRSKRTYDWYVRIPFNTSDASKFSTGTKLYTAGLELNGEEVNYTDYGNGQFRVHIYVQDGWSQPGSYPVVNSSTVVNIGQPATGGNDIQLGTDTIPLVSLRLAPSVDNNLTGNLGERDIINRMQLKLNEIGLILTHDCEVALILNGDISTVQWENVKAPSLSQLIKHDAGDQITGGTEVFSFRAAGGADGSSNTSNFSLGDLIDMGNSILGGDGIFPNGPDILTVAIRVQDTSSINATQPFTSSSRITWSESQA